MSNRMPNINMGRPLSEIAHGAKPLIRAIASVALLGAGCHHILGDMGAIPKIGTGYLFDKDCDPITDQDRQTVDKAFAAIDPDSPPYRPLMTFRLYAQTKADKYGLTLADDTESQDEIGEADTVGEIVEAVDDFTHKYGFKFGLKKKIWPIDPWIGGVVNENKIPIEEFRDGASDFVTNLHFIPVELIKLGDISGIEITDWLRDGSTGDFMPSAKRISLSYDAFVTSGPTTSTHELTHGIDREVCGVMGARRDPELRKLNEKGFKYGKSWDSRSVASDYGATNTAEDKAEIGEGVVSALDPSIIAASPQIKSKVKLLFARMEHRIHNVSRYLVDINNYQYRERGNGPEDPVPNETSPAVTRG